MLSLRDLVRAARAQCLASTILFEAGVSGGQPAGQPAEVAPEEPRLFPRRDAREAGSRVVAEASWILEGERDGEKGGKGKNVLT